MNLEQVSLKTIRVMLAVGAVAALAAVGTLAVLAEVPAASQDLQPYAGAQVPSALRADGPSIDHATVNRDDLEASPASPELSVAAYGS